MSVIQMRLFSHALNMYTAANIILPLPRDAKMEIRDLPVIYLLHGMGDDYSAWLRKTGAERYALENGIAIVMPDGGLSCYENMAHGLRYMDYIARELPAFVQDNFPVSSKREKNFIAGCSMGGFGALKIALAQPESWSAAGCFSAAHFEFRPDSPRNKTMLHMAYGGNIDAADAKIAADAAKANAGKAPLRILHYCGDGDILRENALKSRAFFEALPAGSIDYRFEMLSGRHDWALWDECLHRFIRSLNPEKPEVRLF